ncbi:hypothetical protein RchiOBHm_Chr6g0310791 [Rosa chinensis]|uniref:Uncharacterized protein n=1 Tax=Rosa chinensis TaxID=74649 RepID=A0A2P6Q1B0_ROSCH|nr:hypothetical protein RchiOBHm_Chr6g0310791 [Rosa chinensis]
MMELIINYSFGYIGILEQILTEIPNLISYGFRRLTESLTIVFTLPASFGIRAGIARSLADDGPREKFTTTNLNDAGRRVSIKESFVEEGHAKGFALGQPHQSTKKKREKKEKRRRNMEHWIFTTPDYNDFRTTCVIKDKVCSVIIDSGLRENFVANKVVDYFQLPTVKLSDLYWIPFGEDEYAQVTEVCKVPVSMGKFYKEEITCHVIDMDDTDVLFGRPWHESVKGGYCRDNTYLFRWESHKIKIKPRRNNVKNDHPEVCEKEHEEATLKIEEKLIKDKEVDSFITSISMSCMSNFVQDQPKEKSLPIPFQVEEFKFQDAYSKLVYGIGFMFLYLSYGCARNCWWILAHLIWLSTLDGVSYYRVHASRIRNHGISAAFVETQYKKLFLATYCSKYAVVEPTFKSHGFAFVFRKGSFNLTRDVSSANVQSLG